MFPTAGAWRAKRRESWARELAEVQGAIEQSRRDAEICRLLLQARPADKENLSAVLEENDRILVSLCGREKNLLALLKS